MDICQHSVVLLSIVSSIWICGKIIVQYIGHLTQVRILSQVDMYSISPKGHH